MATRFRFELESLLRLRELEEDRFRRTLFDFVRRQRELETDVAALVSRREGEKATALAERAESGSVPVQGLLTRQRFLNVLSGKIVAKREEIARLLPEVGKARRELAEASRRRKVVEKLRERRKEEFDREVARAEMRELDEIGQIYHETVAARERNA